MEQVPVVLIVEDDELLQRIVKDALSEGAFDFMTCVSGEEALTSRPTRRW
ncbi:hypothetical protein ACFPFP_41815 [Bradyrhizobium sp. GCM10023182]